MDEFLGISLVLYWAAFTLHFTACIQNSIQISCYILVRMVLNVSGMIYFRRLSWQRWWIGAVLPNEVFKTVLISKLHLEPKLQQLHRLINHDTMVNRNRRGVTLHSGEPSKMWCQCADNSSGSYLLVPCGVSAVNSSPASHGVTTRPDLLFIFPAQRGEGSVGTSSKLHNNHVVFLCKKGTRSWVWRTSTTGIRSGSPAPQDVPLLLLRAEAKKINTERQKDKGERQRYSVFASGETPVTVTTWQREWRSEKTLRRISSGFVPTWSRYFGGGFILVFHALVPNVWYVAWFRDLF